MKSSHNFLFAIFCIIGIGSVIFYLSCSKTDQCHNVVCLNGGSCDGGKCTCPVGFEGPRCDSLSREKFVFSYSGSDYCGATVDSENTFRHYANSLRLTARIFNKPLELLMTNFLSNPDDSAVCTMLKTDSFSFLGANNSTTYYGTGWLRHDTLLMAYHVTHDTTSYYCHYLGLIY